MLKKNLKYDFKSFGLKAILGIAATVAMALGVVFLFQLYAVLPPIKSVIMLLMTSMSLIAVLGPVFIAAGLLVSRYNQSMSGDESYLTFTLPVKISTHLFSKAVSTLIYSAIAGIATVSNIFIVYFFGLRIGIGSASGLSRLMVEMGEFLSSWFFVPLILTLAVSGVLFVAYVTISISTQFYAKNKKAVKFLSAYIMILILQIVHTILLSIYKILVGNIGDGSGFDILDMLLSSDSFLHTMLESSVLYFVLSFVLFYFLSKYIYTKKINIQ